MNTHTLPHRVRRVLARLTPYTPPWAATAASWPLAHATHAWLGDPTSAPWASAGLVLLGTGLSTWTWQHSHTHGRCGRYLATATVAASTLWVTAATVTGPATNPLPQTWAICGMCVAAAWNTHRALRTRTGQHTPGTFDQLSTAIHGQRPRQAELAPAMASAPANTGPRALPAPATAGDRGQRATRPDPVNLPSSVSWPAEPGGRGEAGDLDRLAAQWGRDDLDEPLRLPDDPEPDLDTPVGDVLPEDAEIADVVLPGPHLTRAQALTNLHLVLGRMATGGQHEFTVRDLPDPMAVFGRGRSWLSVELARLAEAGELSVIGQRAASTATVYRITTSSPAVPVTHPPERDAA